MKRTAVPLLLTLTLLFPVFLGSEGNPEMPPNYKKWLEKEVTYIITPKEESVFRKLETDRQRDRFMEEFWLQRDPTPGSPRNEFKEEHYRRIEYANTWFRGKSKPGWQTERGRIYIILGEPLDRQQFFGQDIYPLELWFYQGNPSQGLESFFYILFYKQRGTGDYVIYSPLRDGPSKLSPMTSGEPWDPRPGLLRDPATQALSFFGGATTKDEEQGGPAFAILYRLSPDLAQASLSLIPGGSLIHPVESDQLLAEVDSYPQKNVDDEYAYEFLWNEGVVEVSYSVQHINNLSVVKTLQDESGNFFVHYSIQPQNLSMNPFKDKYYSNIKISGRITDQRGMTIFQFEREYPLEFSKEGIKQVKLTPMAIQDFFPLVPGNYWFSLLLQNTVSKEFTSFDKSLIIPRMIGDLRMSDIVMAYEKKKDEEVLKSPFKVGEMRLFPSLRREFTPQDTLCLFFQLYMLSEELNKEGWIKYTFYRNGEEHYVRTKRIKEYQDGKNYLEEFVLRDFTPGRYQIKISIHDKDEREVLFEQERFSLLSKVQARPWVKFKKYPGSEDVIYSYIQGMQAMNKLEMGNASKFLENAYRMKPEREDFAIAYALVLLTDEEYEKIKEVLSPFANVPVSDHNLYYFLGRGHQGLEEYEKAISCYQSYISHESANTKVLNSIAECYFQIGNHREALRAWEKSLEINPNQPEVKRNIEKIKRKEKD